MQSDSLSPPPSTTSCRCRLSTRGTPRRIRRPPTRVGPHLIFIASHYSSPVVVRLAWTANCARPQVLGSALRAFSAKAV
ncbi:hypothetical protein VTJ04DRAFT_3727 [Mycothermus thermophilus]|uniref:uncharacterized protein n=1 Tax=Humicola insolens TaxID=85995 RepID=UPI003743AC67